MHCLAILILALGVLASSSSALCEPNLPNDKPPFFLLAGDSTTAPQNPKGGGWGDGFLNTTLKYTSAAGGINFGKNGATTRSFREDGSWGKVIEEVAMRCGQGMNGVWVTVQFGHNDQKPASNISLDQYKSNLGVFVDEVREAGGEAILVTPLTRRNFDNKTGLMIESLKNERFATIEVAKRMGSKFVDLNAESERYCNAIGEEKSWRYDLVEGDHTHLNDWGSVVFGRLVSDLLVRKYAEEFGKWTVENRTLSEELRDGVPA